MKPSVPSFSSLAELVDWAHYDHPSAKCAYLVKGQRPCERRPRQNKASDDPRSIFASRLEILTGPSGRCSQASPQFRVFEDLAVTYLCSGHEKYSSQATEQWLDEFNEKRTSIIYRLEDYYNLESGDLYTEDEIIEEEEEEDDDDDDGTDESTFESDSGEQEPDEELDTSEEKEDVSILSSQSSSLPEIIRRAFTIQDDEVAKDVTCLLERPVKDNAKKPGWIYIISPPNLPGILKVGYTKGPPSLNRFGDHKHCHGDFKVIKTKLIPYAYRVEQLLLTEFSNNHYKLKEGCHKCSVSHRELLDINKESLLRSLEKWIDFVESYPYSRSGRLTEDAKERLPLPALKSYLRYKGPRRRLFPSPTPDKKKDKKKGSRDSQITPPPPLEFKAPTSTTKSISVAEVELNPDDLCSAIEELQLTPSRNGQRAKGVFSGRKRNDVLGRN